MKTLFELIELLKKEYNIKTVAVGTKHDRFLIYTNPEFPTRLQMDLDGNIYQDNEKIDLEFLKQYFAYRK